MIVIRNGSLHFLLASFQGRPSPHLHDFTPKPYSGCWKPGEKESHKLKQEPFWYYFGLIGMAWRMCLYLKDRLCQMY